MIVAYIDKIAMAQSESDNESVGLTTDAVRRQAPGGWHHEDSKRHEDGRYVLERPRMNGGTLMAFVGDDDGTKYARVGNIDELRAQILVTDADVSNVHAFLQRWLDAHREGHDPSAPDAGKWSNPEAMKLAPCECDPVAEEWYLLASPTTDPVSEPVYECQTCGAVHPDDAADRVRNSVYRGV